MAKREMGRYEVTFMIDQHSDLTTTVEAPVGTPNILLSKRALRDLNLRFDDVMATIRVRKVS